MSRRPHRSLAALPAVALSAAALLLVSGCSGSGPATGAHPSINFGPQASTTPGMTGGGTAAPPQQASSATPPAAPTTAGDAISINNFAFVPATLTVPVGATVTWTNQDQEPHTVVANDGSFRSPGLGTGATYSYTFPTAGSFDYTCSIHPFMHGTVVVTK
jgi:plastocyanin